MSMTVEELRKRAEPWTSPVSDGAPGGSNATADPLYDEVRTEIAKRDSPSGGQVVWRKVIDAGTELLQSKSKDLLVTAYMAYGLYATRGLDGMLTGVSVLAVIIEDFWPVLYPEAKRIRGRVNALQWFVEAAGQVLPNITVGPNDRKTLEGLSFAAKRLSTVSREKFGDNCPALRPLLDGVERLAANLPPEAPPAPPEPPPQAAPPPVQAPPPPAPAAPAAPPPPQAPAAPAQPQAAPAAPAAPPPPPRPAVSVAAPAAVAAPADPAEIVKFLSDVGGTLVTAANTLRTADNSAPLAYRMIRTGLYLHLTDTPPAEGGKTKVPPPSPALRAQLEKIAQNGKWAALLEESEGNLRASRFWLDLHRYSAMSLVGLGATHTRAHAELLRETRSLLQRLPALPTMQFGDGSAFADEATRAWLDTEVLAGAGAPSGSGASAGGGGGAPQVVVVQAAGGGGGGEDAAVANEARKLAAGGKLAEALGMLQGRLQGAGSAAGRFRARIAIGQSFLAAGQPAMARAVFEATETEVAAHGLETWEPALASASAEGLVQSLRALAKGGKPLPPETSLLYDRVCRLDPTTALRLGA